MNIVLTGFMGTGKTRVGRRLAKRLGWSFVDVDTRIEAAAACSIARIFAERGEAVFRRLERRCISRVARGHRQVIATGGGAFLDPYNRSRLRAGGPVICLTAQPRVVLDRIRRQPGSRPLLAGAQDPLARVRSLLERRASAYAQADLTIDTTALSVGEVADRLWTLLGPCLCQSWRYLLDHSRELSQRYGGKYIVVAENRILGSGVTHLEAYRNAALGRPARIVAEPDAGIYYIPSRRAAAVAP